MVVRSYTTTSSKFNFFFKDSLVKLLAVLYHIFSLGGNIVFIDFNFNFNYLPLDNRNFFCRSKKKLQKMLNYFNVKAIIYFNINKKQFIIKKLHQFKLINISCNNDLILKNFDLSINTPNTHINHYLTYIYILSFFLKIKNNNLNTMVHHYYFSNLLIYTINILLIGTFVAYLIYFFSYVNQYQNLIKHDSIYNLIKIILTLSLGLSYIFFIFFLYYYFSYYISISSYLIFNDFRLVPTIYVNLFLVYFEFSVDFFGLVLLFLGYFVGILSLLALDNRIF